MATPSEHEPGTAICFLSPVMIVPPADHACIGITGPDQSHSWIFQDVDAPGWSVE